MLTVLAHTMLSVEAETLRAMISRYYTRDDLYSPECVKQIGFLQEALEESEGDFCQVEKLLAKKPAARQMHHFVVYALERDPRYTEETRWVKKPS